MSPQSQAPAFSAYPQRSTVVISYAVKPLILAVLGGLRALSC